MTRRTLLQMLAAAPVAARDVMLARYEIFSVRVPFAERVREAWIQSWVHQKRDQSDYTLHFVRLHSTDGLTGIGEAKMPRDQAEAKLKALIGKSLAGLERSDDLRGIVIAIADLLGKAAGKPVSKLLNPAARDRIIPTWWSQCFPPDLMASEAKLGASLGYRVHKVKARPWQDPVDQAAAMCAVVPKSFKIWVDANSSWQTVVHTIDVTRRLAKFSNYFAIESPIPRENIYGYRQLRGKLPLKISEHVDNADLDLWSREKLLDAWIVGAQKVGRYVETMSARAETAGVPIWIEHSIDNGVAQVFQAHQVAAYRGLEYSIAITHVLADDCMKQPFTVRDGYYSVPKAPGLGVDLDDAAIDRYRIG
ncbi:MAG: enolase C-terminal domain-like protein [Bryobacteraceae bacterium]